VTKASSGSDNNENRISIKMQQQTTRVIHVFTFAFQTLDTHHIGLLSTFYKSINNIISDTTKIYTFKVQKFIP